MFTEVAGNVIVVVSGGVFYQRPVYRCTLNDRVFVKHAGGYIRLGSRGATSKPKVEWLLESLREAPNVGLRSNISDPEFA